MTGVVLLLDASASAGGPARAGQRHRRTGCRAAEVLPGAPGARLIGFSDDVRLLEPERALPGLVRLDRALAMSALVQPMLGSRPTGSRRSDDFHQTPRIAVEALLGVEQFTGPIWEPACGLGAISEVLIAHGHDTVSSDLVPRGYGQAPIDFLLEWQPRAPNIISNPPFKLALEFAENALRLTSGKVAMLLRLAWLEGQERRAFFVAHPPARVWVFSKRLPMMHRENWTGRKASSPVPITAWFVWEYGHVGPARRWIGFRDRAARRGHGVLEPAIMPRPDQLEALAAILDALDRGLRRPLVEAPCAWGKSVLIAMLALALIRRGLRVLILAHRHELLRSSNTGALLRLDPTADVGICSASLRSDRLDAMVVVGGTATVFRRLQRLDHVDTVLLDEAHLLGPGSSSMLGTIRKSLGNPPLIGFTATPYRTDSGSLINAELFDEIVWRMGIIEAIDAGLLVPLVTKSPRVGRIETSYVPIERGEFQQQPLEQAALAGSITRDAVCRSLQVADEENRQALLFFAIGVAHCAAIGIAVQAGRQRTPSSPVKPPQANAQKAIARFRAGELLALVNCNVLTTGFDARNIDLIAFMRPTVSPVLWTQACRTRHAHMARRGQLPPARFWRQRPAPRAHQRDQAAATRGRATTPRPRPTRCGSCPRCDRINDLSAATVHLVRDGADQTPRQRDRSRREHSTRDRCRGWETALGACARMMRGGIHEKPGHAAMLPGALQHRRRLGL